MRMQMMQILYLLLAGSTLVMAGYASNTHEKREVRALRPVTNSTMGSSDVNCGTSETDVPDGDMMIRFNKVYFPNERPSEANWLLPFDYPICASTAAWLRKSTCWSVITTEDCRECEFSLHGLVETIGGYPKHPSWNASAPYWNEFREVITMRKARIENKPPINYLKRMPRPWQNFTLHDVAEAVHNEYPGKNQAQLIENFIMDNAPMDREMVPSPSAVDFLRNQVTLAELNTWAIAMIGPYNFALKWMGGRARPEEVAWYIAKHNATDMTYDGVPKDIVDDIMAMDLQSQFEFTAYPEGSPTHPSWPAMHSAASVASFWLSIVMNLTPDQLCEAKALDFGVSYGRTVAGVHFPSDNIAGLTLGQELLSMRLPDFLHTKFGADKAKVQAKVLAMRHDWNTYLDGDCFTSTSETNR